MVQLYSSSSSSTPTLQLSDLTSDERHVLAYCFSSRSSSSSNLLNEIGKITGKRNHVILQQKVEMIVSEQHRFNPTGMDYIKVLEAEPIPVLTIVQAIKACSLSGNLYGSPRLESLL